MDQIPINNSEVALELLEDVLNFGDVTSIERAVIGTAAKLIRNILPTQEINYVEQEEPKKALNSGYDPLAVGNAQYEARNIELEQKLALLRNLVENNITLSQYPSGDVDPTEKRICELNRLEALLRPYQKAVVDLSKQLEIPLDAHPSSLVSFCVAILEMQENLEVAEQYNTAIYNVRQKLGIGADTGKEPNFEDIYETIRVLKSKETDLNTINEAKNDAIVKAQHLMRYKNAATNLFKMLDLKDEEGAASLDALVDAVALLKNRPEAPEKAAQVCSPKIEEHADFARIVAAAFGNTGQSADLGGIVRHISALRNSHNSAAAYKTFAKDIGKLLGFQAAETPLTTILEKVERIVKQKTPEPVTGAVVETPQAGDRYMTALYTLFAIKSAERKPSVLLNVCENHVKSYESYKKRFDDISRENSALVLQSTSKNSSSKDVVLYNKTAAVRKAHDDGAWKAPCTGDQWVKALVSLSIDYKSTGALTTLALSNASEIAGLDVNIIEGLASNATAEIASLNKYPHDSAKFEEVRQYFIHYAKTREDIAKAIMHSKKSS